MWPPVAGKFRSILFMLHATGGQVGTICMRLHDGHLDTICLRLAASRMHFLHPLAASTLQSRQFFESTLPEQLFELKNEGAIKKSGNLPDTSMSLLSAIHKH
jgi:hypothetical protein